ncbi:OmpW family protein [Ideonella sp. 4Y16]|uniref:OmpW family protein n=1 Tax=Ideonella alba TaxID=2824118 RepID=A0A941BAN9_9BURK|nr:OmpW family outer membrane protein [Ideonella alba]MBQ0930015.1 OmpW family protein [Ideonella alba]MBQ0946075.1 OmpW family protein [Ideonella alba]
MFRTPRIALLAAALLLAGTAQAQSAGALIGRIGATSIQPNTKSGDLTAPSFPGTQADIGNDTQLTAGLTWMWTDNISLDLPLAAGFKHELTGAGAIAGVGKIGEVKALPITLLAQYRFFEPSAKLRPYVGIGPTYARFYKARGTATLTGLTGGTPTNPTTLEMDSKLTFTAQLGLSAVLTDQLGLDVAVMTTPLKTRATLSTGQTLDAKVNPTSFSVGLTMRF